MILVPEHCQYAVSSLSFARRSGPPALARQTSDAATYRGDTAIRGRPRFFSHRHRKILDVYVNVNNTFAAMHTKMPNPVPDPELAISFTIGELSRQFSVTTRTIRFYEDEGLLAPRRAGQNRVYTVRDRVRLKLILRGKRLGFSIKEIKDMVEMYDAPEGETGQLRYFVERMCQRREDLLKQRHDIEQVLTELDQLQARCESLIKKQLSPHRANGA